MECEELLLVCDCGGKSECIEVDGIAGLLAVFVFGLIWVSEW